MNKMKVYLLLSLVTVFTTSCLTTKEVRYQQPNEHLVLNEEGLIPYSNEVYRVTKADILNLNIVTTPKGDAAQFYSSFNTSGGENGSLGNGGNAGGAVGGGIAGGGNIGGAGGRIGGNRNFYFNGLKVNSRGNIDIMGIGEIKAVGRTIEDIEAEIQSRVNENFIEGKTQVRLNTDGITFYLLSDIEEMGNLTGEKRSYTNMLSITEALAQNGGLNRTVDRRHVVLQRKYPEGIKRVALDLTRDDIMNSPYYWVQNGDMIYLNTRSKSLYGFGKEPLQTLTTGVSLITTALSVYLLISRF
ncbi:polysaccharide biosynthesis/export family protein [Riemerella anatipestifer]|uniref:Protein involved in gliding motility epsa n=1 Tax=Riemerella anatipestifer (strain ATCC 11845 / DSM 15868 / JCM 9532 / NCTC 11014) TaxID=693978 RepID=E4TAM0_RIEAD|nr:polysaccharide biosynthesis/export family protein [Riemerella anatipestifer]ADQ82380.1 protein involved in gliding motility EpsA [Riemerella anatipestifer ATCC 11845 = DSM 15868]ADZ12126.1 polysaccharide export protein, BexD/CtrA/VexA family protein [Riemerella anatipestifer RA-GD]AFD56383.1 protein involved in gliding motility epsa [Riemerella anatipestifer ATCC 11845 = DSM 15868]AKP69580.1 gliding motility protein epsa [Riemerella anatipestifer]AKP71486.1 gliding motility protein epsa [Ri